MPGSITIDDVRERMARLGVVRGKPQISNLERGAVENPPKEFVAAYARAIGATFEQVWRAFLRAKRERRATTGKQKFIDTRRSASVA